MATEWFKAPEFVINIAKRLIDEYHEPLKSARIGFIMRSEAPYSNGRYTYGKAEKVSAKAQVHLPYDFIIWIAKDMFAMMAPLQREALIDHELCHLRWDEGELKADLRPHDVEEFTEILERYGYWWPHAERFAEVAQQALLFETEGGVEAIEPHMGEAAAEFVADMDALLPGGWAMEIQDASVERTAEQIAAG